jgi:hypothetical protein
MPLIGDNKPRFTVRTVCPSLMFDTRKGLKVEKSRVNTDLGF